MPTFARSNQNFVMRCDESAGHRRPADNPSRLDVEEVPTPPAPPTLLARALLAAVRGYQVLLSPLFGGSCRYVPSCSQYTAEALRRHGAVSGAWLGLRRVARCHPFGASGFDPVPDRWPPARHDCGSRHELPRASLHPGDALSPSPGWPGGRLR
jgi:uncharacterized protein